MCGISGIISFGLDKDLTPIIEMNNAINHRGPNDSGLRAFNYSTVYSEEITTDVKQRLNQEFDGVIGFKRLSILDLSIQGHQPMTDQSGTIILAFNGEIYNSKDIKIELADKCYRFKSQTDTEVILYAYMQYGFEKMVKKLNGMFSIVLVDLRKGKIFLTRDRIGIKPLYYCINNNKIMIASEIKSFIYDQNFQCKINKQALFEYFTFGDPLDHNLMDGGKSGSSRRNMHF